MYIQASSKKKEQAKYQRQIRNEKHIIDVSRSQKHGRPNPSSILGLNQLVKAK